MRWSKLKKLVEANFADSIRPRLALHSAAYGNCSCGHLWITLDKTIVANFCTRAYWNLEMDKQYDVDLLEAADRLKRYSEQYVEYGEMSRQDAYQSCWAFLHELAFDDALASDDPLVQTLAVLDKRLGKRRYAAVKERNLHPLAQALLDARLVAEASNRTTQPT